MRWVTLSKHHWCNEKNRSDVRTSTNILKTNKKKRVIARVHYKLIAVREPEAIGCEWGCADDAGRKTPFNDPVNPRTILHTKIASNCKNTSNY